MAYAPFAYRFHRQREIGAMLHLQFPIEMIVKTRAILPDDRAALVAISGIDASGKGYLTVRFTEALQRHNLRVANINIDGWLNLPHIRFDKNNPAENFYLRAIRFEEMFVKLVFPLRDRRSVTVEMDYAEETAAAYRRQAYAYADIDVILLEGIYLLKRGFQPYYDLSFWIDCSFETALERALARGQEGLTPTETAEAYRTIYFPAQEIHFARDNPRQSATAVVNNDPRLPG
jgi:uridine kinase